MGMIPDDARLFLRVTNDDFAAGITVNEWFLCSSKTRLSLQLPPNNPNNPDTHTNTYIHTQIHSTKRPFFFLSHTHDDGDDVKRGGDARFLWLPRQKYAIPVFFGLFVVIVVVVEPRSAQRHPRPVHVVMFDVRVKCEFFVLLLLLMRVRVYVGMDEVLWGWVGSWWKLVWVACAWGRVCVCRVIYVDSEWAVVLLMCCVFKMRLEGKVRITRWNAFNVVGLWFGLVRLEREFVRILLQAINGSYTECIVCGWIIYW